MVLDVCASALTLKVVSSEGPWHASASVLKGLSCAPLACSPGPGPGKLRLSLGLLKLATVDGFKGQMG